ncbi:MAG: NFACT RNA binding domain-containing protein [Firmicutes bacterium]|nr:NFACT RNA binding domain-containing protein [Bacillota bacterium]
MALDGAMLHLIKKELEEGALGAKVDKVYQPSREMIILAMRGKNINNKLLISASANSARIHFTDRAVENPAQPPMLCMLLRKKLCGARLSAIKQVDLERVLLLEFDAHNELGDEIVLTLAVEIMGRHSNIILVDERGLIVDSVKRIDSDMSSMRFILPGLKYELPPAQNKINLKNVECGEIIDKIKSCKGLKLDKAILNNVQGFSPIAAREISFRATGSTDLVTDDLTASDYEKLLYNLEKFKSMLDEKSNPTIVSSNGKLIDFTFFYPMQYGASAISYEYKSYSEMLDNYYFKRDLSERMKSKSQDLLKVLTNSSARISKKIAIQREELKKCANREQLRINGDLVTANIHLLKKGDVIAEVVNYFSEDCSMVKIKLDPTLTPAQNAQKYYKEYRKAQIAETHLVKLIAQGEDDLKYIDSVFDALSRAESERELAEIRSELTEEGIIKSQKNNSAKQPPKLPPLKFISDDGFTILIGRNNQQNDKLTLKDSRNYDIWLHTLNIPGSHTVIVCENNQPPNRTIEQAAQLAAYHSSAKNSGLVAVDYTLIKYVTKPRGAKPGMVIYTHQSTVYVHPDEELVKRLAVK